MSEISKEQIEIIAEQYFNQYEKENVLHIATDGNVFLNANKAAGSVHARSLGTELVTVYRPKLLVDLGEEITDKSTVEEIKKFLDENQIAYPEKAKKAELLELVKQHSEMIEMDDMDIDALKAVAAQLELPAEEWEGIEDRDELQLYLDQKIEEKKQD